MGCLSLVCEAFLDRSNVRDFTQMLVHDGGCNVRHGAYLDANDRIRIRVT